MIKQAAIQASTLLILAAIVALWNYYQVIAVLTLLVTVAWLGLEGYARYTGIKGRRVLPAIDRGDEREVTPVVVSKSVTPHSGVDASTTNRDVILDPAREGRGGSNGDRPASFSGLLQSNTLSRGDKVLLGFSGNGQPVYGTGTTTGLAGKTGGGKTVTTCFLMAERVVQTQGDVRFIIVDPHMFVDSDETLFHVSEPLTPFFLTLAEVRATVPPDDHEYLAFLDWMEHQQITNPNSGGDMLRAWARLIDLEFHRRLRGKTGPLWVWVIDEFNAEMEDERVAKAIEPVLGNIGRQARKMNMNAILIAQVWTADAIGGKTKLRKSIAQMYCHRLNESDASLILPAYDAKTAPKLDVGEALVYTSGGDVHRLRIPLTTEFDLTQLAATFGQDYEFWIEEEEEDTFNNERTQALGEPEKQGQILLPSPERNADQPVQPTKERLEYDPVELEQVRQLFTQDITEQNIAKLVFGVKTGGELEVAVKKVRKMLKALME